MCVFIVGLYCVKESEYCVEKILTLSIIIIIRGYENRVIYYMSESLGYVCMNIATRVR